MDSIKKHINELEYILVGTLSKRYGPCGKKNCRCRKNKNNWHGPYYIWTRKEKGKTITKSLSKEQAIMCKKALKNMKYLQNEIEQWKMKSVKAIEKVR
jgi:hypothetical protein